MAKRGSKAKLNLCPETDIKDLIQFIRESHLTIPEYEKRGGLPWDWLNRYIWTLAKDEYKRSPHWHHWAGKCIEEVPFELIVGSAGLFGAVWYFEIMLRKARDRHKSPERVLMFRKFLDSILDAVQRDIEGNCDIESEEVYKRDGRPINRWKHLWNTVWWRH